MAQGEARFRALDDVRRHIHETLCRHENLLPEQFELQEMLLTRQGNRCGMQFILRGPRNVRLGAVWAADRNHLYFYDARGERFRKEVLPHNVAFDDAP